MHIIVRRMRIFIVSLGTWIEYFRFSEVFCVFLSMPTPPHTEHTGHRYIYVYLYDDEWASYWIMAALLWMVVQIKNNLLEESGEKICYRNEGFGNNVTSKHFTRKLYGATWHISPRPVCALSLANKTTGDMLDLLLAYWLCSMNVERLRLDTVSIYSPPSKYRILYFDLIK